MFFGNSKAPGKQEEIVKAFSGFSMLVFWHHELNVCPGVCTNQTSWYIRLSSSFYDSEKGIRLSVSCKFRHCWDGAQSAHPVRSEEPHWRNQWLNN
jgi:hypothetical protein